MQTCSIGGYLGSNPARFVSVKKKMKFNYRNKLTVKNKLIKNINLGEKN